MATVAIRSRSSVGTQLHDLSSELIMEIMQRLNPTELSKFATSCRWLLTIFNNEKYIVMTRLLKNLPEYKSLLYICTSRKAELHPTRILYPRFVDFQTGTLNINLMQPEGMLKESQGGIPCKVPLIRMSRIEALWFHAKVVDWWVETYPRLRWRDSAEDRRTLRASEEARLRQAIGNWWLYAHFHHGAVYWYRNLQQPKRWDNDTRLHLIRVMTSMEILELSDLWRVIQETVSKDLCSSPERVCLCEHGYSVDLVPWGTDEGRHSKIVKTFMKLDPEQLRYFLTYYPNCKKDLTIPKVSECLQDFGRDTETLSISLTKVLQERTTLKSVGDTTIPVPQVGIVDEDRKSGTDHWPWEDDAWPDGQLPLTQAEKNQYGFDPTAWVARGDDGADMHMPW